MTSHSPRRISRKTSVSFAAALLTLSILFTGCGLRDSDSPTTDGSSSADQSAESGTPAGETTQDGPGGNSGSESGSGAAADWPEPADAAALTGPSTAKEVDDVVPLDSPPDPEFPATITDDRGEEIVIDSADRVLALDIYGTLSDVMIGLGLEDTLVGRTTSDDNESLKDLPNVTENGHSINTEAVMQLEPDLVLTDTTLGPREAMDTLEASGVKVVYFTPDRTLDGVEDFMREVAATVGVPEQGEQLIERFTEELEETKRYVKHLASATTDPPSGAVLYVRGQGGVFFIMNEEYGASDLMSSLLLEDAATEAGITGLQPANAEALADLDPEIIFVMSKGLESTGGLKGLLKRPGIAQTRAGEDERIVDAPDTQLLSFGPRAPAALASLAEAVYLPEDDA